VFYVTAWTSFFQVSSTEKSDILFVFSSENLLLCGCIITLNKIYVKDVNDTRSAEITPDTVWGLKKGLFSKSILMDGEVIFTYTQPETAAMEKLVKALNALCGK
jgi:hypothetical protein